MKNLNREEFQLLGGTDIIVNMLRTRVNVGLDVNLINDICNYLDVNGTGFYHQQGGVFYFEEPMDYLAITKLLPEKEQNIL